MTVNEMPVPTMEIYIFLKSRRFFLKSIYFLLLLCCCAACSVFSTEAHTPPAHLVQMAGVEKEQYRSSAPVFLIENAALSYNKIGTPAACRDKSGGEIVFVDAAKGTIYRDIKTFSTETGQKYTNLIYRVHFEKVPFSLNEIHLTAGNNVGLLVICTMNEADEMVLLTTVHTCGCFLAFIPTQHLPVNALPVDWPKEKQNVYQQILPAFIQGPNLKKDEQVVIRLEHGTHRVSGVEITARQAVVAQYPVEYMQSMEMASLWHLPFEDSNVSFFEQDGCRQGYVKNSEKPLERLFLSWFALDWHVGEDKSYGDPEKSRTVFYTSLKFWQRNESDMEDFARFLRYWGWRF